MKHIYCYIITLQTNILNYKSTHFHVSMKFFFLKGLYNSFIFYNLKRHFKTLTSTIL